MACIEHGHSVTCFCVKLCPECLQPSALSYAYDRQYCKGCNAWLEDICDVQDCRWCKNCTTLPVIPT